MSRQTRSYELFDLGYFLEKPKMEWYTAHYLARPEDALDPMASPLLGDVSGVCPAALLIAGFDPLRDEGHAYADRLREAGVSVQHHCHTSLVHGYVQMGGAVDAAQRAIADVGAALRRGLLG